ncbi:MAG: glycosyltransferase, partial [Victivallales bacterium]
MTKINILTNNSCPNSKAFNCPLLASKPYFEEKGFNLDFHWKMSESIFNCDILFINSNVFRSFWSSDKNKIFKFLESARIRDLKILWFDTTDSTWCTQFEVMPYVNLFLKSQVLKDRKQYLRRFRTGRIFTDYFDDLYKTGEKEEIFPLPSENDLGKIRISWNTCFENYNESRFGIGARIMQKARPLLSSLICEGLSINFTPPNKQRNIKVSCRVGLSHSRPSVVAHRNAVIKIMGEMNVPTSKISLSEYFSELRDSQIGIGPFGVGEITLRDFEIIICGAALVKPDMSHLETWPPLFQPERTFVPGKWDLSDLKNKMETLIENPDLRIRLSMTAQKTYMDAVSPEGLVSFAE